MAESDRLPILGIDFEVLVKNCDCTGKDLSIQITINEYVMIATIVGIVEWHSNDLDAISNRFWGCFLNVFWRFRRIYFSIE